MPEIARLAVSETVDGRPFTHPDRTADDRVSIDAMLRGLRGALREAAARPGHPLVLSAPGPAGLQHRIIVCDDRRLATERELPLVGFFGLKRLDRDCSPLTTMDDELILEFPEHPGVLSYSSLELPDGNWGNLIALDSVDAREHWRTSAKHAYAAQELAPRYYTVVRLHHLVLPGGLGAGRDPILLRTKYYDFQGPEAWRAEREIPPA